MLNKHAWVQICETQIQVGTLQIIFFRLFSFSSRIENFGCKEEKVAHLKIHTLSHALSTHLHTLTHTYWRRPTHTLTNTSTHVPRPTSTCTRYPHTHIFSLNFFSLFLSILSLFFLTFCLQSLLDSEATCLFLLTNFDWVKHLQNLMRTWIWWLMRRI